MIACAASQNAFQFFPTHAELASCALDSAMVPRIQEEALQRANSGSHMAGQQKIEDAKVGGGHLIITFQIIIRVS